MVGVDVDGSNMAPKFIGSIYDFNLRYDEGESSLCQFQNMKSTYEDDNAYEVDSLDEKKKSEKYSGQVFDFSQFTNRQFVSDTIMEAVINPKK